MNKFLYSMLLCALIGWPSVRPATKEQPVLRTAHTVSGGLALASAASAVVTGFCWLYSVLNERGVSARANAKQEGATAVNAKIPLAPRAVIAGASSTQRPTNIKRPSWLARFFLRPTTHAGTKRWRTAFIASLAAALAGGTVWGATKQQAPQKPVTVPDEEQQPAVPAVALPAAGNGDNHDTPARTIAHWWRQQRQRQALAAARRQGAQDAQDGAQRRRLAQEAAHVGALRHMRAEHSAAQEARERAEMQAAELEGRLAQADTAAQEQRLQYEQAQMRAAAREVVQGAVSAAAVNVADRERERAQMQTADLEGKLARSEERLTDERAKQVGKKAFARLRQRLYQVEREGRQRRIDRLHEQLAEIQGALAAAQAEAAAQVEANRAEIERVRRTERVTRDTMVESTKEQVRAASERRFIATIQELQEREKELQQALAEMERGQKVALRHARAEGARSTEELRELQVRIAQLEAEGYVSQRTVATQTGDDITPPVSPASPVSMPDSPVLLYDEEGKEASSHGGSPDVLTDEDEAASTFTGTSSSSPSATSLSSTHFLSSSTFAPVRGRRNRGSRRPVTQSYNALNNAGIKKGDKVSFTKNDGTTTEYQFVTRVGLDSDKGGVFVEVSDRRVYDDSIGMADEGKEYTQVLVRRLVSKSPGRVCRKKRPVSATPASRDNVGAALRQMYRLTKGARVGGRPPSASRSRRPGSA